MTDYVWIKGKCSWAKVYPANMDTKFGNRFTIELDLDEKAKASLTKHGWRSKLHTRDDGTEFGRFARNNEQMIKGKNTIQGPPAVTNEKGSPFTDNIGNGSEVAILLEIYDSAYGRGSRLREVKVLNLVPYANQKEIPPFDPDEKEEKFNVPIE